MHSLPQETGFWTIGKKLSIGFTAVLAMLAIIAGVAHLRFTQVTGAMQTIVDVELKISTAVGTINDVIKDNAMATVLQAMVPMQERAKFRNQIQQDRERFVQAVTFLNSVAHTSEQKEVLATLDKLREQFVASQSRFYDFLDSSLLDPAYQELNDKTLPVVASVKELTAKMEAMAQQSAGQHAQSAMQALHTSSQLIVLLTVIAIAAGALTAWRITRGVTGPIAQAVEIAQAVAQGDLSRQIQVTTSDETALLMGALSQMNQGLVGMVGEVRQSSQSIATASSQISSGNQDLSSRTEEQASALEETAAAMQQIMATVEQNFQSSQHAQDLAIKATDVATHGGEVVSHAVRSMQRVSNSGDKIADIVGMIEGIAFQTNILALNAAVEAARAGEQGRGFAVVATEVRALAGRSATASKEIKELILASVQDISEGRALVNQAGQTMQEIVQSVRDVAALVAEVTASSREQSNSLEHIKNAVVQMDNVTQQNAALVEEGTAAAHALAAQAQGLIQTVSVFHTDGPALAYTGRAPLRLS